MRLASLLALHRRACGIAATTVLPSVADAQSRRAPSRITVTTNQSYLYPGTDLSGAHGGRLCGRPALPPGVPTIWNTGPGGDGGRFNLPQPFELGGIRPLQF